MKKVLFISNKYITGLEQHCYYADFLHGLRTEMFQLNYDCQMVFFSTLMQQKIQGDWIRFYPEHEYAHATGSQDIANRLESQYRFTFNQAFFGDVIQLFPTQLGRTYHVPEWYLKKHLPREVGKVLFLEKLFSENKYDLILVDQSPESEMEYARAFANFYKIPFIRYTWAFLGRTAFHLQRSFGEEELLSNFHNEFDQGSVSTWLDNFIEKRAPPYGSYPLNTKFQKVPILEKINLYGIKESLIKIANKAYMKSAKIWLKIEEKFKDLFLYQSYSENESYLFFPLQLPTEATVSLRSMPYQDELGLVETISRCLPYGVKLYTREHPHWRTQFPFWYLWRARKIPNVRLLSPKIPIYRVLSNSRGVLELNSSTGVEGLIYGKPLLSFSENVCTGFHPAALKCENLFEIGEKLSELLVTKVHREDTVKYLQCMFNSTFDFKAESYCITSAEEAKEKSKNLVSYLSKALAQYESKKMMV